jgi:hypothetical protein
MGHSQFLNIGRARSYFSAAATSFIDISIAVRTELWSETTEITKEVAVGKIKDGVAIIVHGVLEQKCWPNDFSPFRKY